MESHLLNALFLIYCCMMISSAKLCSLMHLRSRGWGSSVSSHIRLSQPSSEEICIRSSGIVPSPVSYLIFCMAINRSAYHPPTLNGRAWQLRAYLNLYAACLHAPAAQHGIVLFNCTRRKPTAETETGNTAPEATRLRSAGKELSSVFLMFEPPPSWVVTVPN